jgi:hypothetical protein
MLALVLSLIYATMFLFLTWMLILVARTLAKLRESASNLSMRRAALRHSRR